MKPFIVKERKALKALPYWLKEQPLVNTCSFSTGNTIQIGHDTKPDSDWGGKYTMLNSIVILDPLLFDEVWEICERFVERKDGTT